MNKMIAAVFGVVVFIFAMIGSSMVLSHSGALNPISLFIMLIISIIGGAAAFKVTDMLIETVDAANVPPVIPKDDFKAISGFKSVTAAAFEKTILDARSKQALIVEAAKQLPAGSIRDKVNDMLTNINLVIEEIKLHPNEVLRARSLFNTYMDQIIEVIEGVVKLKSNVDQVVFSDFTKTLDNIIASTVRIISDIQTTDLQSLQINMSVLNDQLKVER